MNSLQGKYALITGASQGLGLELAIAFARAGAAGIAIVARNKALLDVARDLIQEVDKQIQVLAIVADVSQAQDIERIVATTLNAFGGHIDILVNNASTIGPEPMPFLLDYPLEDFRNVLNTNLIAPFLLIKKVLPAMIENGGSIINVTSDAGITGYPGWGAYGISKFGLEGLSQTWAAELEESNVRVNWVDPGNMNTAMHRAAEPDEDPTQWANPAYVTSIFVYLASDESKHVNGQRFHAQTEEDEPLSQAA
ncbi:3-oxoacyl-[acyl-carrier-protein] reductase [Calothrix sp. NIES-4071]|nr:3-oxoacyl-[acyl-carrier-protein] reductase [Calothrix sp. NIES-4071]BAZ57734.1 3-oxoacyl-[acyl-carrier-protein] reductase [Calothrix sp. NIES-4105]